MLNLFIRCRSRRPTAVILAWAIALGFLTHPAGQAQEQFRLIAPNSDSSQATLSNSQLRVVSASGQQTTYDREPRFDSAGGEWLGYYSPQANQVLRWPSSNRGPMQIGQPQAGQWVFRMSQMQVERLGNTPRVVDRPILPSPNQMPAAQLPANQIPASQIPTSDLFQQLLQQPAPAARVEPQVVRLAAFDEQGTAWLLARDDAELELRAATDAVQSADWWIMPAGGDLVRIQTYANDRGYAVTALGGNRTRLQPLGGNPGQLWRLASAGVGQRFLLQSVQFPGVCLSHTAGRMLLQPIQFAAPQLWMPLLPPPVASYQPFWRTVSQDIQFSAPLPPAQLELFNSHRNALVVLIGSSQQPQAVEQLRIEPQSSATISLPREAGATLTETAEIRSPLGGWQQQRWVTHIPSSSYYDLSVYEEHLQSIAIDRTGKSPQPIEDINYVPKSIGWLPLPAGPELPATSRLDVYSRAVAARNPGAVRRLDPQIFETPAPDRLESILQEFQDVPRRSF